MFFKFKLLVADGVRTIGASVCAWVCKVVVKCTNLVALKKKEEKKEAHTQARNKSKKEREKKG